MMSGRVPSYRFEIVCPNYEPDPSAEATQFPYTSEDWEEYKLELVPSKDSFYLSLELPGRQDVCLRTAKHVGQLGLKDVGIVDVTMVRAFVTTDTPGPEHVGQAETVDYTDELFLLELDDAA